jgi:precorrin-6Y C5,15-methyltransferase (decarboxylating)
VAQDAAMTRRVVIIGIGADGMSGLAEAARTELVHAKVIYGSSRELALLDETVPGERREWGTPFIESLGWIRDDAAGDVHIVASGDPMLCGIGAT